MDAQDLRELVNPPFDMVKSCVQIDAAATTADVRPRLAFGTGVIEISFFVWRHYGNDRLSADA